MPPPIVPPIILPVRDTVLGRHEGVEEVDECPDLAAVERSSSIRHGNPAEPRRNRQAEILRARSVVRLISASSCS
jgi:hypothetical protein